MRVDTRHWLSWPENIFVCQPVRFQVNGSKKKTGLLINKERSRLKGDLVNKIAFVNKQYQAQAFAFLNNSLDL